WRCRRGEATITKTMYRCRFSASGSPGTNEMAVPNVAYGQNHRFITRPYMMPATSEYADSSAISGQPVALGNSPASTPTQAQANIWNGIHGPNPLPIIATLMCEPDPSAQQH